MLQLIIEGWGYITLEQIPHYTDIATLHPNPILSYSQFITGNFHLAGLALDCITPSIKIMGHRTKRFFQWSGKMGERF